MCNLSAVCMIICISYHDEKSDAFIISVTTPVITGNKQRKTPIISHGKKLVYKSQDIPHYMMVKRGKCWSVVWQQQIAQYRKWLLWLRNSWTVRIIFLCLMLTFRLINLYFFRCPAAFFSRIDFMLHNYYNIMFSFDAFHRTAQSFSVCQEPGRQILTTWLPEKVLKFSIFQRNESCKLCVTWMFYTVNFWFKNEKAQQLLSEGINYGGQIWTTPEDEHYTCSAQSLSTCWDAKYLIEQYSLAPPLAQLYILTILLH